jgi:hypothetical protein
MSGERAGDLVQHRFAHYLCPAQIAAAFFRFSRGEVAGAGRTVLGFAAGGQPEPFFGSLVGFLLGHFGTGS